MCTSCRMGESGLAGRPPGESGLSGRPPAGESGLLGRPKGKSSLAGRPPGVSGLIGSPSGIYTHMYMPPEKDMTTFSLDIVKDQHIY
jgi:hypothetical protein